MAATVWTGRTRQAVTTLGTVTRASHSAVKSHYDAVIIGGGHNGLVAAAYLQKGGLKTAVLERRHVLGGAAVSEEIIPGFHFSRCSYLLSLLRPHIFRDLELKKHGLKLYMRDPHAFTPMLEEGVGGLPPRSLLLGSDLAMNQREIGKFSETDAKSYPEFITHLDKLAVAIHPLLDSPPVDIAGLTGGALRRRMAALRSALPLVQCGLKLGKNIPDFYEIITAPIMKILNRWFESEPLKATLATDAVIGAMTSPNSPGSGYVLLHHVMGELEKEKGAWGYVEGGMGGVSKAIASSARSHGADIFTEQDVHQVLVGSDGSAKGVVLKDGTEIYSRVVLSNATPYVTFKTLTPQSALSPAFIKAVDQIDYTSPVTKINESPTHILKSAGEDTPDMEVEERVQEQAKKLHHLCAAMDRVVQKTDRETGTSSQRLHQPNRGLYYTPLLNLNPVESEYPCLRGTMEITAGCRGFLLQLDLYLATVHPVPSDREKSFALSQGSSTRFSRGPFFSGVDGWGAGT
ncbi:pyridine nucleotide-disulfide oxidoreductase domain-containing protein 2 isoform X2 [Salmo trutta]|uniref:pyridine nucleotide-disulfide oxidoreductase domain-containing protein 2 isoform X2 n=1 Tax=Salmo trutta TaxID=8032 RepID=UPI0011310D92|nr:pyridine nucleotide-disulfide oxidoreductase domain-containing protein 2 isoform X2 [Salmo trutta]